MTSSGERARDRSPLAAFPVNPTPAETDMLQHANDPALEESRRIGPFVLGRKLGAGGMGEVFLARQVEGVQRTVALKLLRGDRASADVLARFEHEREMLARMQHSCIARILDAGIGTDGRPWFAMEYVDGVPITRYCDERRLDTVQRLRLFQRVCEAVEHAHQKAILHRDLKPSNILVTEEDGRAIPKIIDFGVAKALGGGAPDRLRITRHGDAVGTPAYMSPEQAQLTPAPVDTRTDVYALGVVLYELLVGSLPFSIEELHHAGLEGMWRMIREREPVPPSLRLSSLGPDATAVAWMRRREVHALESELHGDLDLVVVKSLQKDPERRYGSASDFARDVERFLAHEPVAAHPPGRIYRVRRALRRHRAAFAAASTFLVLLCSALVALGVQNARIAQARDRANLEATTAARTVEFLIDLFGESDPMEGAGVEVSAGTLLDRGARRLRDRLGDEPQVRAHLLHAIGSANGGLGRHEEAKALIEEALRIRRELHRGPSAELAESLNDLGNLLLASGELDSAVIYLRRGLVMREAATAPDAHILTEDLSDLAVASIHRGEYAAAESLLVRAIAIDRVHTGRVHADLLNNLGGVLHHAGDLVGAEPLYLEALHARELEFGPDHPTVANSCNNLGKLYKDRGELAEAEHWYARALAIRRERLPAEHPDLAVSLNNLARLLEAREDHTRALELYDEAERIWTAAYGPDHWLCAWARSNRGSCLLRLGRLDEAGTDLLAAHERLLATFGPEHPRTLASLRRQAEWYERRGDAATAERLRDQLGGDQGL